MRKKLLWLFFHRFVSVIALIVHEIKGFANPDSKLFRQVCAGVIIKHKEVINLLDAFKNQADKYTHLLDYLIS